MATIVTLGLVTELVVTWLQCELAVRCLPVEGHGGVAAPPQQSDVLHQALHAAGQVVVRQHVPDLQLPLRRHATLHGCMRMIAASIELQCPHELDARVLAKEASWLMMPSARISSAMRGIAFPRLGDTNASLRAVCW